MYVTGIGRTKFGTLTETMPELIYQAMYNAINDSPVSIEDIGAVYVAILLAAHQRNSCI